MIFRFLDAKRVCILRRAVEFYVERLFQSAIEIRIKLIFDYLNAKSIYF